MFNYKNVKNTLSKIYQETKQELGEDFPTSPPLPTIDDVMEIIKLMISLFFIFDMFIYSRMVEPANIHYIVSKSTKLLLVIVLIDTIELGIRTFIYKCKHNRKSKYN